MPLQRFFRSSPTNQLYHLPSRPKTRHGLTVSKRNSKLGRSHFRKIDNWFGEVDPQKPASATIRVMIDNYWNEYDNFEIKPRIRGKIKLPTLENA